MERPEAVLDRKQLTSHWAQQQQQQQGFNVLQCDQLSDETITGSLTVSCGNILVFAGRGLWKEAGRGSVISHVDFLSSQLLDFSLFLSHLLYLISGASPEPPAIRSVSLK